MNAKEVKEFRLRIKRALIDPKEAVKFKSELEELATKTNNPRLVAMGEEIVNFATNAGMIDTVNPAKKSAKVAKKSAHEKKPAKKSAKKQAGQIAKHCAAFRNWGAAFCFPAHPSGGEIGTAGAGGCKRAHGCRNGCNGGRFCGCGF